MIRPELQELRSELGELRLLKFLTDVDLRPQLVALDHLISTQSPPDLVDAFGRAQRRGHPGASSPPRPPEFNVGRWGLRRSDGYGRCLLLWCVSLPSNLNVVRCTSRGSAAVRHAHPCSVPVAVHSPPQH